MRSKNQTVKSTAVSGDPKETQQEPLVDVYFSADVETDGPIPGPFSMLSFALVYAGRFDGVRFQRPGNLDETFYKELKPISDQYEPDALRVNGLDRNRLCREGASPEAVMTAATQWVNGVAGEGRPAGGLSLELRLDVVVLVLHSIFR